MADSTQWQILSHPYSRLHPLLGGPDRLRAVAGEPGSAIVWRLTASTTMESARLVEARPGGLALLVVLPEAHALSENPALLDAVHRARPKGILPHHLQPRPSDLAEVLRCPPIDLAAELTDYLLWRGAEISHDTIEILRRIIDLSARTRTVNDLARRLYMSRRALGRRLAAARLPVPSHWLQVARLLRVISRLQNSEASIFSVGYEMGYPDGFAVSNQMHRLLGYRPSDVRERLGWEWVFETWLRREENQGRLNSGDSLSARITEAKAPAAVVGDRRKSRGKKRSVEGS